MANITTRVTTPVCMFCRQNGSIELTVEEAQALADDNERSKLGEGKLIQQILPNRTADEREQIISGTHPKCWEKFIGEDEN